MNTRSLLVCWLLVAGISAQAQLSMTLQVPPAGVMLKNQLWNMLVVNSNSFQVLVRVNLVLLDEKTNQPVLTATTMPVMLEKGARQLQAKDLGPIQYNYTGPAFHADQDPNGMLPVGTYQACYTLLNATKSSNPMVENCIQLNVDPLSPPLLNTPADEGMIYADHPQFTWLPPTPVGLFNDLSYSLVLVEVLAGQGKGDAVQQNIPLYSPGFIREQYLNYPSSYRALDTGRLYAWRIVALNNGLPAAMSDIWTFRVTAPPKPGLKALADAYVYLKRDLDAAVATSGPVLKMNYENLPADSVVSYRISGLEDPGNPVVQQGQLRLTKGRNLVQVPLQKSGGFIQGRLYLFQLVNSRNESWSVKFTTTK